MTRASHGGPGAVPPADDPGPSLGYVLLLVVRYGQGRIPAADAQAALPDVALGILFIAWFALTRPSNAHAA